MRCSFRQMILVLCFIHLAPWTRIAESGEDTAPLFSTRTQIESDWLYQAEHREPLLLDERERLEPKHDATGGCDGVKNGLFGFHTAHEAQPWWQVDLGRVEPLMRLEIYNRCGSMAGRAARIRVLLSADGKDFQRVYQHDGSVFHGFTDGKPLVVPLAGRPARYVRLQLPQRDYFHLDEVEVYGEERAPNIAQGKPATQSSLSQWSIRNRNVTNWNRILHSTIERGRRLGGCLQSLDADVKNALAELAHLDGKRKSLPSQAGEDILESLYLDVRRTVRGMALSNPLLDFDRILFVKRAPSMLPHISDQYYGWWSRPGGGIYILEDFKRAKPRLQCLTEDWPEGNFLRPDLAFDGRKILFGFCRYYAHIAGMVKIDKEKLPEDAFYHLFEMNLDGTGTRQITRGRYDDFDGRYLPDGGMAFLSTRKGQFIQSTMANSEFTQYATLPDSYVRCGGDDRRPVPVYTLHALDQDGKNLRPLSAFETFEYTPTIASDGRILYARWDYIDRPNGHYFSLWSANQDGTNPGLVYGNYTIRPQAVLEARSVPGSNKFVFTASAHHSITGGSLVLLDRQKGIEGEAPLTRLTPEVPFPETEDWGSLYYSNPFPLSEDFFLVTFSNHRLPPHRGGQPVTGNENPINASGLYLLDRFGNLELIYRDADISSMYPIPVRPWPPPPGHSSLIDWDGAQTGNFLVQDIYRGLEGIEPGSVKALRIIGVPPKTQPHMNTPSLGVSREDPGKYVIGTVPVEADGSAYFRAPSGVPVFFQALDGQGMALQTMRTLTYILPGQTLSCVGCHESRDSSPPNRHGVEALRHGPSVIRPGPKGSWPLRFDRLVQPVLDRSCTQCHSPDSGDEMAARFDLTPEKAYRNLLAFADGDLEKLAFEKDASIVGHGVASQSKLLHYLVTDALHESIALDKSSFESLVTWLDTYAQRLGSFSEEQEKALEAFRRRYHGE